MDIDESSLPSTLVMKEEKVDDDFFDPKFETPKRGRSRSLSKKNVDKVDIRAKLGELLTLKLAINLHLWLIYNCFDRTKQTKCSRMQSKKEASLSVSGRTHFRNRKSYLCSQARNGHVEVVG